MKKLKNSSSLTINTQLDMNNIPRNLLKRSLDYNSSDTDSSEPLRKKPVWYRLNREPPPAPKKKKPEKPTILQRKEHNRLAADEKTRQELNDLCDAISDISIESDDMDITMGINTFPSTLEELISEWNSKLVF